MHAGVFFFDWTNFLSPMLFCNGGCRISIGGRMNNVFKGAPGREPWIGLTLSFRDEVKDL